MIDLLKANYFLIMGVYGICLFIAVLYLALFRHRGRVQIRIKTPLKEIKKWVKPDPDGKTIVMNKGKRKGVEWKFTFTQQSIILFSSWFRERKAIDVFYHSPTAIDYLYKQNKAEHPKLTKKDVKKYATFKAVETRYQKLPKLPLPPLFWLILAVLLANFVISLMLIQGIRF